MEVADAQPSPAGDVQVICESGPQPAPGAPERAASVALSAADQQSAASAALAPHPAASATLGPAPSEAAATCPPPAATALLVGRVRRTLVDVAAEARGKVSPVWQFFEKFDKPVNTKGSNTRCKIANGEEDGAVCGRLYKHTAGNGTSSLIDHLAKEHQEEHKKVMGASAHSKETRALKGAAFASAGKSPFSAKAKETTPQLKARLDRKSVIWCVRNGRPWHALHDAGLKLILAEFVPDYAASSTSHGVLDKILSSMYDDAKASLVKTLEQVHTDLKERGYNGPFCSLQLDLTSVASNEFCTASVSVVEPGGEETPLHLNLATKVFSGTHKQADVKRWIEQLTSGIFASFIPGVKPKDVYIAATVDQGLNVVNACKALGLETLLCLCHRINSLVLWAVGISGSAATCQNPPGRALVGAGALTVGVFSHSCCNTDAFRKVQEELIVEDQEEMEEFRINAVTIEDAMPEKSQDGLPQALNFIRRNDTRWTSLFRFVERLCILEEPVSKFLQDRGDMAHRGLSPGQWMALKELCSLLEPLKIVTVKIQGGVDGILSRAIHLCHDLGAMLGENEVETIDWASRRRRAGATEGPMRDTVDLTEVSQTFLKVACDQIEKRKIGTPEADVELLALWLDPRFKNLGPNDCGGVECRDKARKALDRVKERMVEALPAEQSGSSSSTNPPPAKRLAVAKNAYERRQQRRRETDAASVQAVSNAGGPSLKDRLEKEVDKYNDLPAIAHGCEDFSPLGYWHDAGSPSCDARGNIVAPAQFPILSALARVYFSVDSTSCQSERDFSQLALTYSNLRQRMGPERVEKMMFLKLNPQLIPEIKELDMRLAKIRGTQADGKVEAVKAQAVGAGKSVVVDCTF